ncbi:MAG: glycosyltransferase family 2 protein [Desulfuromonadaceae bacterium]|nr:glycosyltransferase family 2 protein [Desulfuromonadaceae bacterium]MDD5106388.1 glycosyltransferase family 2 protein [Desulfuromonadaceae bacterium]
MSGSGKISAVTVVRNDAAHLERTILSVIEQKATSLIDYIVIDGGSTDETTAIIRKYSEHIIYWVSEPDAGIYDAMNKGWSAAEDGSFILFLGAGDRIISLPETMTRYGPNDVVYGSVQIGETCVFTARTDFHLKLYNSLHHQALLVNKSLHPAPPFNCNYQIYADFDFNQRLKIAGAHFVYTPDFTGYARPGGVSDRHCFAETVRIVASNFGFLWAALAFSGYYAMKVFPVLKRLRPYQEL